jgi:hypothetical protein
MKPATPFGADALGRAGAETRTLIVQSRSLIELTRACLSQSAEALAVSRELLRQPIYKVPLPRG